MDTSTSIPGETLRVPLALPEVFEKIPLKLPYSVLIVTLPLTQTPFSFVVLWSGHTKLPELLSALTSISKLPFVSSSPRVPEPL